MAPILIDKRDLLKLGFVSVLVTFIVFSGGVFFGYERATTIHQAGNEVKVLALPVKVFEANALEPQHPETIAAGATIDVDFPESQAELANKKPRLLAQTAVAKTKAVTGSTASNNTNKQKAVKTIVKASSSLEQSAASRKNRQKTSRTADDNFIATALKKQPILFSSLTNDQISKVNYSIQVGMYGQLSNAESMMKMLHEKNLDAYVSDYTNKKGETRYNVRIGYFADKKAAISSLKNYRNIEKADGYLVNFSAESIVNVADARNKKVPNIIEETKPKIMPGLNSAAVTFGKALPTDVLSVSHNIKNLTTN